MITTLLNKILSIFHKDEEQKVVTENIISNDVVRIPVSIGLIAVAQRVKRCQHAIDALGSFDCSKCSLEEMIYLDLRMYKAQKELALSIRQYQEALAMEDSNPSVENNVIQFPTKQ